MTTAQDALRFRREVRDRNMLAGPELRHRVLVALGVVERTFNPAQPRDPHSGEWIDSPIGDAVQVVRELLTAGEKVGSAADAERIAGLHADPFGEFGPEDLGWESLGAGQHRSVYLDPSGTNVYKVGLDSANRHEVDYLKRAKERGEPWAPDATLYEVKVTIPGPFADEPAEEQVLTVVAMPYLPEDESVPFEDRPVLGPDFNPANVVANGGQLWLIDAGGI